MERSDQATDKYVTQLEQEGWCVMDGIIPADEVDVVREEVETSEPLYKKFSEEHDRWSKNVIAFFPALAPHLSNKRFLNVVKAILGPQVRISQTEYKIRPPHYELNRAYHSDFPHDLKQPWHVSQPFPKAVIGITTLWMLTPFTTSNGGTWVVPGTHVSQKNPRGENDGIDEFAPIPGEFQATGDAGSVLIMDSRIWHSNAASPSEKPRTAVVVRYAPWWLNLDVLMAGSDERARIVDEAGGTENNVPPIPPHVYDAFPNEVKPLFRHWVRENRL
jgi:hypothetical protein